MTDKPTPKEMDDLFVEETGFDPDDFPAAIFGFALAVLAKWGQPAQAAEPFCWHWENTFNGGTGTVKKNPETLGINMSHPDYKWTALYTAPQPTQPQAAQAVVQDDLITIRKPTTSAELLWLLKLEHLVISDVDKTLEETFAPAQPVAQQGVAYAALPEPYCNAHDDADACYPDMFSEQQMRAFADATHTLRASHGQAPAGAGEAAEHYRNAIARACEGWTMPDGLRKHLETALWSPPTPQPTQPQAGAVPLTPEQIQDLLLCGDPTDEEMRLIRIGWDAAHGIKGGQHVE